MRKLGKDCFRCVLVLSFFHVLEYLLPANKVNLLVNNKLISNLFGVYCRLIPHSPATEPWELKKFLNCVKMASERLKEDGGKFDEKRFVKSVSYLKNI